MCYRHWQMVPNSIARKAYTSEPGTPEHTRIANAATGAVCLREHGTCTPPELAALVSFGYNEAALKRGVFLT